MKMFRCLLSIASLFFTPAVRAETLPSDLQPVTLEQAVAISDLGVNTYSMAHYGSWPPLPFGAEFVGNYPLYVSQSTAGLFYDDREAVAAQMLLSAAEELLPPPDGDTNSVPADTNYVYSAPIPPWTTNSTNLFLEMFSASPNPDGVANLVLHNSRPNHIYYLVTTDNLTNTALTNWTTERMFLGAVGTNTPVTAFIKGRTNQLFFAAMTPFGDGEHEHYSVVARVSGQGYCYSLVNGVLATNYQFTSDGLVGFTGEVDSLNLGLPGSYDWTSLKWDRDQRYAGWPSNYATDRPWHLGGVV